MHLRPCRLECSARVQDARCPVVAIPLAQPRERGKRRASGLAGPSGGSRGCHSTSPAISGRYCAWLRVLYLLVFNEGYSGNVDLAVEAIGLTLPHPAARQPVSRHSLNYFALRDSSGSSGCMVSSSDLGGDDSGGRGGGDRRAWSGTGQPAALPDRAAVTATRPRSGGRASAWRRLAGAAVPGLWRPGAGLRPARGGGGRGRRRTPPPATRRGRSSQRAG